MKSKVSRILVSFLLFIIILNTLSFAQVGIEDEVKSYLLGDYESGEILMEYNIYNPVEIASISKLMSYLLIMENIKGGLISLEDIIHIDKDTTRIKGSSLELEEGETFTVSELLEAVLVVSANDATYALAKHVAGTEKDFVDMMNEKAKSLDLKATKYINSTGLPDRGRQNTMSTQDIFILARYILENYPEILTITTIQYVEVPDRGYIRRNTNPLLNQVKGVDGLKTGYTKKAGYCLVTTAVIDETCEDDDFFRLISIVMGTESVQKQKKMGKTLLQYGIDNFNKKILVDETMPIDIINVANSRKEEVEIYPSRSFSTIIKSGDNTDIDIIIDENLKAPLKKGTKVGKVILLKNGQVLDEIDLITLERVSKEGIIIKVLRFLKKLFLSKS